MTINQQNIQTKFDKTLPESNSLLADVDIAIVGGGVVGCAVARRMSLEGASVVLIEKAADILDGASKGNSAILHTGFDAPVGTLEWECVQKGYDEYLSIRESLNLPLLKSGALVAAWTIEEEEKFSNIIEKGFESTTVVDIIRRVRLNEYKRKQAPMGLKVTSKAFGYGRRFPNAQNFRQ